MNAGVESPDRRVPREAKDTAAADPGQPVREDCRKRGVARALYQTVERMSPSPRLFSSTEETNAVAILHTALGFHASGYIDNLPRGYRELLFDKRLAPEGRRIRAGTYEVGGLERPRADYARGL